jgi:protein involved in polysaccharide export with SLBB domain
MVRLKVPSDPWESADLQRMASHQSWQWTAGVVGLLFSLMLMWGCTPPASQLAAAQTAAAAVATPDQATYLLGPEDTIETSVWKEPDLTKQLVVRPDGKSTYPLIGEVEAAGRPVNVMQGISMAGGLTPMVLRTVAGKEEVFLFNYKDVSTGQFLEQNHTLLPGDVVVVP